MSRDNPTEALTSWLLEQGMQGAGQEQLLEGYCEHLVARGLPVLRVNVAQTAYHPKFGAFGFRWVRETGVSSEEYEISEGESEAWQQSPLYHLVKTDQPEYRERLVRRNTASAFPLLNDLKETGATDYFAAAVALGAPARIRAEPRIQQEGILISWTSDGPEGFSDHDLDFIRSALPPLGLALKSASNQRMAEDLLGVYLGRDAGLRVLSGEIQRGSLQQVNAAIANFDLSGFTTLSEKVPAEVVIDLLNDYFELAVGLIDKHGGHVLKFMGDGILAMFDCGDEEADAIAALNMAVDLRKAMRARNAERSSAGLPMTDYTLALHAGDILYGNIGAETRLDFTVIGPAVNQGARLSEMHRPVGQSVIVSEAVASAAPSGVHDLVPMGRFMLRGVPHPQSLYTIFDAENP